MSSGVEFEEDKFGMSRPQTQNPGNQGGFRPQTPSYGSPYSNQQATGLAGWLQRHGLAKSNSSAQVILIGIVIVNIIITFIVIRYFL